MRTNTRLLMIIIVTLCLSGIAQSLTSDNIIHYFNMNSSSGIYDLVGSKNSTSNDASFTTSGKIENAYKGNLNATTQFGNNAFEDLGTSGTVNLWIKRGSQTATGRFIDFEGAFWVAYDETNGLQWLTWNGGGTSTYSLYMNPTKIPKDAWTMLTFTYNTSVMKIYLNGTLENTTSSVSPVWTGSYNHRFFSDYSGAQKFNATLDEIGMWNKMLNDTTISNLYFNGAGCTYPFSNDCSPIDYTLPKIIQRNLSSEGIGNTTWNTQYNVSSPPTIGITLDKSATAMKVTVDSETNYSQATGDSCTGSGITWSCVVSSTLSVGGHVLYFTLQTSVNESFTPLPSENKINISIPETLRTNFTSQTPSDISSLNIVTSSVVVTYNVTTNSNVDKAVWYYKTNNTFNNIMLITNGTPTSGYLSKIMTNNTASNYTTSVMDNQVLPATYNFAENLMENYSKVNISLTSTNTAVKTTLLNVTNATYGFFEFNANATTATVNPLGIHYCNSSYTTGNYLSSPYCTSLGDLTSTTPTNHTHTINSAHHVFSFSVINNKVNTIGYTPTSHFILHGNTGVGQWNVRAITNISRTDAVTTTNNIGVSWTNYSGTTDLHLHQFLNSTTFYHYACANTTYSGLTNCSTLQSDLMQLAGLQPTSPEILTPTTGYYNETIYISWNPSTSPNNYPITNYTLWLANATDSTLITYITNTSVTNYTYNASGLNNNYTIRITAKDNQSQFSNPSFSDPFTIDTTKPVITNIIIIPTNPIYSPIGTVNTSITATDTYNITVTLQLDNDTILTLNTTDQITYNYTYNGVSSGYHNFTWIVTDLSGNTETNTTIKYVGNFSISDCTNTTTHPYRPINATIKLASTLLPVISNSVINLQAYYQTPTNYQNYSFTFTNTANWSLCQNTNETLQVTGTINYQDTNATYAQNTYTWTNADFNSNTQLLDLYLFPATTPIVITVLDEFGNPVSDATVQVLTTIGGLTYATVSTLTTGYDGKTVGNLVGYTQWYKFNVIKGGTTLLATSPILITSTTITLNLPSSNSWITAYDNFQNTICTVAYNNATGNMRLDWINSEGNVIQACLEITKDDILHTGILINTTCTSSASGTILVPINLTGTSKSVFTGTGKITANQTTFQCGTPVSVETDGSTWKTYNTEGISYAFIIVLTMFAIGIWNPVVSILLGMIALIVVNILGFYVMSIPVLVGIIIIMGVAMWRLRQK